MILLENDPTLYSELGLKTNWIQFRSSLSWGSKNWIPVLACSYSSLEYSSTAKLLAPSICPWMRKVKLGCPGKGTSPQGKVLNSYCVCVCICSTYTSTVTVWTNKQLIKLKIQNHHFKKTYKCIYIYIFILWKGHSLPQERQAKPIKIDLWGCPGASLRVVHVGQSTPGDVCPGAFYWAPVKPSCSINMNTWLHCFPAGETPWGFSKSFPENNSTWWEFDKKTW